MYQLLDSFLEIEGRASMRQTNGDHTAKGSDGDSATCEILIAGIGSPHGDDQAGWNVIEKLQARTLPNVELRKLSLPHDLLDWLNNRTHLHIVDAWNASGDDSDPIRVDWMQETNGQEAHCHEDQTQKRTIGTQILALPVPTRSGSSHQIDLPTVLELASSLKMLPRQIVLWIVPGHCFEPNALLSTSCQVAIERCVAQMEKELGLACSETTKQGGFPKPVNRSEW